MKTYTKNLVIILLMTCFIGCGVRSGTKINPKDRNLVNEFYLDIAMGDVPGYSSINKFGHNPTVEVATDPEDVWAGGGVYGFYPTEAVSVDIVSTDADDTAGDTGARTVIVYGLDGNWLEQSETVTLNGATEVALQNEYIRLYRAVVLTAGSTGDNEGDITVQSSEAAGGINDNTVGIYIATGDGQTQQAIYTIPAGKSAYFVSGYVGISKGGAATVYASEFKWKARLNNGVTGAWQTKGQIECVTHGGSWWQYEYGVPAGPLPEKTDIRIECSEVTGTLGVVGGFDLILVDN